MSDRRRGRIRASAAARRPRGRASSGQASSGQAQMVLGIFLLLAVPIVVIAGLPPQQIPAWVVLAALALALSGALAVSAMLTAVRAARAARAAAAEPVEPGKTGEAVDSSEAVELVEPERTSQT